MEYLTLNNGIRMPLIGFGTFMLGGGTCPEAVSAAIENGCRMIDTAEAYGNEKEVGKGIKQSGVAREELFLVTKVNFKSYENAAQAVRQSLAALQTDYIDLLLLHWPFANYYAAWRVLENLYAEGRIRAIGVSNFEPDQLLDLIAYNKVVPAVNQIETNLYCQRSAERRWMDKKQVAHILDFRVKAVGLHLCHHTGQPNDVGVVFVSCRFEFRAEFNIPFQLGKVLERHGLRRFCFICHQFISIP